MASVCSPADETVSRSTKSSALSPTLIGIGVTGVLGGVLFSTKALAAAVTALPAVSDVLGVSGGDAGPGAGLVAESLRLVGAALIGVLVTFVQRHTRRGAPLSRSMEQAQVLLCVAGALTMMLIGNSLPRAFGIAGAASIIRFRTPVDDPRDAAVLFLLMALGMAVGLGAPGVAFAGTLFISACLALLPQDHVERARTMHVLIVAAGDQFPGDHVARAFADCGIGVEPVEISRTENAAVRYRASLSPSTSLESVNAQLMDPRIQSIVWQASKKDLAA
jgi:Domain of unknown function (DUF4956)